uniref:voltage-dependent N-type calcium channel subunit alpha-1B-like n=1 Tax=Odobenus rosmarus divergens TaxID=9708 RepID=UPI00063C75FC
MVDSKANSRNVTRVPLMALRQTQESGINESVSWGTQMTQEVPYEARTPLERGHSTEISGVQPGNPAVGVQMQSMALGGPDWEPQSGLESQGRAASMPRPAAEPQPAPNASPMKRSISTLAPQRPHVAHLCSAALDRAPASQAAPHHHHRCHRRRDRKQKSLEKGPSLSADTDGAPSSAAGPGPPPGEGPTGCRRERRQERGRSQERRRPSSSSSEKQRFYSCDCFGGREPSQPKPSLGSHPTSPTAGQEPGPPRPPAPNASPMKRSISTLAPQRPHVAHLCSAALDRAPASQAAPHHHHRCHRRRDRKQKSLEKGPSLSADTDGGATQQCCRARPTPGRGAHWRERRSQERRRPSSSSSEKQRFYSCDCFGTREPSQPKPSLSSHPTSPTAGQEPGPLRPAYRHQRLSPLHHTPYRSPPRAPASLHASPPTSMVLTCIGLCVTYRTANSSPVHFAGAQTSLPTFSPGRLSRGLSEHNALLQRDPLSQPLAAGSRIGSDPYLGQRLDSEDTARTQPEDTLTFEEAVATHSGRSSRTSYVSSLTSQSHPLPACPTATTALWGSARVAVFGIATTTPTKTTSASRTSARTCSA